MRFFRIAIGLVLGLPGAAFGQWTPAGNGLTGSVPGVTALVIDSSAGSTLYALTSANSVFEAFKSTDGGANWKALGNIAGVNVLALDPTSASTIYAGTASGVMTSTDGGDSWTSAGLPGTPIGVLAIDPITPSTLYAGGNGHLYKSTDGGGDWTDLNLGPLPGNGPAPVYIGALILDPFTPSTVYVGAVGLDSASFLKSLDGGESWNSLDADADPFCNGACLLVIDPSNPSTLYRINPFRKSTDGGISWTPIGFTKFVTALAVDPLNSNTLYLSTSDNMVQAIFNSTDGGQTWNAVDMTVPAAASIVFTPDSGAIYAATRGGVFRSTNAGLDWNATNTGLRLLDIAVLVGDPVDPATIYAGGNDGLFKSEDSGGNWSQIPFQVTCCAPPPSPLPFPDGPLPAVDSAHVRSLLIDFTDPNTFYAGTSRSNGCFFTDVLLYKSTDGGVNWSGSISPDNSGCATDGLLAMHPTDPNTLYLQYGDDYDGYELRKSTDGGATWGTTGLQGLNGLTALVIDPTTPATLYAATASTSPFGDSAVIGGVEQSTDGGATWNVVGLANQDVGLLAIDPLQPSVLYAGVTDYADGCCFFQGLFKSGDSGASWSPINHGLGDLINAGVNVNALIVDPDHPDVLYLGTSGYGVFKSCDGGATWAAFNEGLTFLDVRTLTLVRGAAPTVYAGTPGGVFKIRSEIGKGYQ